MENNIEKKDRDVIDLSLIAKKLWAKKKGRKVDYYVDHAGGFSRDAKKRDTYIIYMNGTMARVSHDAKVEPVCEIFVPTKAMTKMSMAEKLAMGSGFASIATMIATVGNLLK